ncbi:hypothetical protein B0H14DRAFT_2625944 [Mycena olivaceomarginata]|nr:hypothetical protein B0H14DRAFT_2625944 [Mycena olivaceomarginata]
MTEGGPFLISFDAPAAKPPACINCRRRKIRCDGERPKCGPWSRSIGFQDCEYADDGPTRTQMLEEQIAILEARIEELEKPTQLRTTLVLYNPYAGERRAISLPSSSRGGSSLPSPSHVTRFRIDIWHIKPVKYVVRGDSGTHYNTVLHAIQAEHLSAAVSLVVSSGLHRIRSADAYPIRGPLGPAFYSLTPPGNTVEECERINAFWTVLTLSYFQQGWGGCPKK